MPELAARVGNEAAAVGDTLGKTGTTVAKPVGPVLRRSDEVTRFWPSSRELGQKRVGRGRAGDDKAQLCADGELPPNQCHQVASGSRIRADEKHLRVHLSDIFLIAA